MKIGNFTIVERFLARLLVEPMIGQGLDHHMTEHVTQGEASRENLKNSRHFSKIKCQEFQLFSLEAF